MEDGINVIGLAEQVASIGPLLKLFMILTGATLVAYGTLKIAAMQSAQAHSREGVTGLVLMILLGGALTALTPILDIGSNTLGVSGEGNQARSDIMDGKAVSGEDVKIPGGVDGDEEMYRKALQFLYTVIILVGLIGFFRGWLMMVRLSRGKATSNDSFGKSQVLIWGGLAAINIPWTVSVIAGSMGFTIKNLIS